MNPDEPSHGGWSDPGSAFPATPLPRFDAGDRYQIGPLLGRGGMGEVYAAHDRALGREVALKVLPTASIDNAAAVSRLAHEAIVTGRLDHPGIVSVHDRGTLPDGRPFYTMRLVRGQTLARALVGTGDRRVLVRHVLAAAEAVAAAHDRGIVHRDLKPSNIFIGERGETQVGDWGLAVPTAAAAADWPELSATPGAVGTAGFMSPEQASAEAPRPTHDVYSLGATLAAVAGELSAEIEAIIARAQGPVAERYPHAGAFADDLLRWFDGRRVAAHRYTPAELLRRTVAAYRAPVAVGAIGLAVATAALTAGYWRAEQALQRAVIADSDAEGALAGLQLEQAVEATRAGNRERAETLARGVLSRRDDPLARGVLAAFGLAERPALMSQVPAPSCAWSALYGRSIVCGTGTTVSRHDGPNRGWTVDLAARGGEVRGEHLVSWDGAGSVTVLDISTGARVDHYPFYGEDWVGQVDPRRPWTGGGPLAVTGVATGCRDTLRVVNESAGQLAAICADGTLLLGTTDEPIQNRVATAFNGDHVASALAFLPGGGVAIGSVRGRVAAYEGDGSLAGAGNSGLDSISRIVGSPGNLLALSGPQGGIRLWRIDTATAIGEIPGPPLRAFAFEGQELWVHGEGLQTWSLPRGVPALVRAESGVADVAVDGERLLVATGDGRVLDLDLVTGDLRASRFAPGVVKSVALGPEGWVATAMGAPHLGLGPELALLPGARALRRIAWLADGSLVGIDLDAGLFRWSAPHDPPRRLAEDRVFVDMEAPDDVVVTLDTDGNIDQLDGDSLVSLARVTGARAVTARDGLVLAAVPGALVLVGSRQARVERPGATPLDVAISADGRWFAAGFLDGAVEVYRVSDQTLAAALPGHTERVVAVEFTPAGDLVTGSWDKTAHLWDLSALDTAAVDLAESSPRPRGANTAASPTGG